MDRKPGISYEEVVQLSITIGNEPVEVASKPGFADWDIIPVSSQILAKYAELPSSGKVLLFGCHHGALSVFLARHLPHGQLWVTDRDCIALEMTRRTLAINRVASVCLLPAIDLPEGDAQNFDAVLVQMPKGRKLIRRWLLQAHHALKVDGLLYLAGANKSGIQSAIKDALELFGSGQTLGYKKGHRIARLVKTSAIAPAAAWAQEPGIAPNTWKEFSVTLSGHTFHIRSLPGVFSYDHLDAGTQMLLEVVKFPPGARVLDVGCGYGIIGMFAAVQKAGWVDLVDSDLLAVASAKGTLLANQIANASVLAGDLLEPAVGNRYDLILSNPPFHAGLAVDYQIAAAMIRQAYHALNPGGQIIIVANRFIRYDRLIEEIFGKVTTLADSGHFHVLCGVKSGR